MDIPIPEEICLLGRNRQRESTSAGEDTSGSGGAGDIPVPCPVEDNAGASWYRRTAQPRMPAPHIPIPVPTPPSPYSHLHPSRPLRALMAPSSAPAPARAAPTRAHLPGPYHAAADPTGGTARTTAPPGGASGPSDACVRGAQGQPRAPASQAGKGRSVRMWGGKTPLSSYIGAGGLRIQALKDPDGRKEDKRLFQTERGLYYPSDEEPAVPSPHPEPCRGLCHPKAPLAPRCVGGAPGHPQAGRLPAPAAVTRGDRGRRGAALGSPSLPVPGPHLSHSLEIPAQGSRCHREMCSWAAWEVESGCSWVRVLCTRGTRGLRPRAHRTGRCTGFGSCSVGRSS